MAALLQLIGGTAGTAVVSLLDDTALAVRSWAPQIAEASGIRMPQPVTESLTVRAYGATHDALATNVQNLVAMQKQAGDYTQDRAGTVPVWLRVQMNSETSARQALVRRIDITHADDLYSPPAKTGNTLNLGLAIEREPYWEALTAGSALQGSVPTAGASVLYDYTAGGAADIAGDVGARIGSLMVTGGTVLGQLWLGLRSANKHGNLGNFVRVWECEDGTLGTDAALATDTTASPGGAGNTKVTVTPGAAGWEKRLTIRMANVTANYVDNYGRFLWLLREKVSAGTWEIQLRFGLQGMPDASYIQGPIVSVTNTAWNYAEMSIGSMPFMDPWPSPSGSARGDIDDSAIEVWARRTAGSGTLDIDGLCPVPVDEGFLKVGPWNSSGAAGGLIQYYGSPRGSTLLVYGSNYETATISEDNFSLPPGDGRIVAVYARNATSVLTDQIQFNEVSWGYGAYFPRWASLRGSA